jgi:DNA-binding IclR family transcriptional regulator
VLASWPVKQREEYLLTHPLPRFTEHSITNTQRFLERVDEAIHAGVSIDNEEYLAGVNAVAAPIYGVGGRLVALLWMVGFASRFSEKALERAAQELRIEAETISRALGTAG